MRPKVSKTSTLHPSGQASTEYLILVGLVLMIFAGTTALFSKQEQNYLGLLFEMIHFPF